jgi:hypothetical protein
MCELGRCGIRREISKDDGQYGTNMCEHAMLQFIASRNRMWISWSGMMLMAAQSRQRPASQYWITLNEMQTAKM